MLFDAGSDVLARLGKQRLGAHLGVTAVLHTVADNLVATLRRCPACPDGQLRPFVLAPTRLAAHPDDDPRTALPPPDTP